jgi:hypothetical protein
MKIRTFTLAIAAVLAVASPAMGHHSDAGVDMSKVIAFEGTVKEFIWKNPHVYFIVETQQDGKTMKWDVQMGSVGGLSRSGWTATTLVPGDKVSVRAHPAADGRPYSIMQSVDKPGGLNLGARVKAPDVVPPATSIAGKWLTDRASTKQYPGGFDGFFHANLTLNDKGKAAQAAYDPLGPEAPEATCVGRPTPAAIVSTGGYVMQIELKPEEKLVLIRSEWYDELRTVYMDGRKHPAPSVRFTTGHSIGHWEGETLVVDTANFADHRSPYQIGVPSGGQKHVVERYTLNKDRIHIDLEWTLEDPEYLAKPMTDKRQLIHSPHLQMYFGGCDKTATSRFVKK